MEYLILKGVPPYDGRYPFDVVGTALTTREWGWIKRHAGYLPLTIDEGLAGADPELFAIFATLALRRAGRIEARDVGDIYERIVDAPFESAITLESETEAEEEDDASPPPPSSTESGGTSGADSLTSLDPSTDESPKGIGTPASVTLASRREGLAS